MRDKAEMTRFSCNIGSDTFAKEKLIVIISIYNVQSSILCYALIDKCYKLINPRISIDEINYGRRISNKIRTL